MGFAKGDRVRVFTDDVAPTFGVVVYVPPAGGHRFLVQLDGGTVWQDAHSDDLEAAPPLVPAVEKQRKRKEKPPDAQPPLKFFDEMT